MDRVIFTNSTNQNATSRQQKERKFAQKRRLSYLEITTDLHLAEALVRDFAERAGITHQVKKTVFRIFTAAVSVQRAQKREQTTRVHRRIGVERQKHIDAVLRNVGWSLRQCVETKLPLLFMNQRLQNLVRSRKLSPSLALLVAGVAEHDQENLLEELFKKNYSVRELRSVIMGKPKVAKNRVKFLTVQQPSDPLLARDMLLVARAFSTYFETRVEVNERYVLVDCVDINGLNNLIDKLGIQL